MKIVFIAGPYWGDGKKETIERNIREAEKYQLALANARVGFFCPHNHTEHFTSGKGSTATEEFFYELDLHYLEKVCDAVLAVPGWENSKGAVREVAWAKANNVQIFYPKNPTDLKDILAWHES